MKDEDILENENLIAKFICDKYEEDENLEITYYFNYNLPFTDMNIVKYGLVGYELSFSSSWDWLMPVIIKFKDIQTLPNSEGRKLKASVYTWLMQGNILKTFEVCAKFVKWYNKQEKQ